MRPPTIKFEGLRQRQLLYERSRKAHAELAYAASCLEMSAMSIAHEVNQPLCAIVINAETCLRRLDHAAPDLELIRELARRVIADARRASEIVVRVSDMAKGKAPRYMPLPFNAIIEEAIACLRHELQSREITVALDLTPDLPPIEGGSHSTSASRRQPPRQCGTGHGGLGGGRPHPDPNRTVVSWHRALQHRGRRPGHSACASASYLRPFLYDQGGRHGHRPADLQIHR